MKKYKYVSVDVEADADSPATGSIVCFGAVLVGNPNITFYGKCAPITVEYYNDNLAISGFTREEHLGFPDAKETIFKFIEWLNKYTTKPIFICDNPAFDWQWINYYIDKYIGHKLNPFGYSARRIGDLYCGMMKDSRARWRWMRDAPHNHNPISDALGNAQALIKMKNKGLKIKW